MKKLILIISILLFAGGAWGATWRVINDGGTHYYKSYVSPGDNDWPSAGDNDGNGLTNLEAAMSTGDTVQISGGSTSETYATNYNLTINGPDNTVWEAYTGANASHNGNVIFSDLYISLYETATFRNFHKWETQDTYLLRCSTNGVATIENTIAGKYTNIVGDVNAGTNRIFYLVGNNPSLTLNRCRVYGNFSEGWQSSSGFYTASVTGTATLKIHNSIWGPWAGLISQGSAYDFEFLNTVFLGPEERDSASSFLRINLANNSSNPTVIKNCVLLGAYLDTGASSGNITASNNIYTGTLTVATFDDADVVTCTDCIKGVPGFTDLAVASYASGDKIGDYVIRVDDAQNYGDAITIAALFNPEVVIWFATEVHGDFTTPTQAKVENWRTLVNNGNEVSPHGATHSDFNNMDAIDISATGTTPTLDISVTQSGDSTTWTGTLTITINGTPQNYDLTSAGYDTVTELVAALNGASIGDGTVTATLADSNDTNSISICLDAQTALDISGAGQTIDFDADAFVRLEMTEPIADLQAYIRTGSDRNSANASGAGAAGSGTAAETYTVQTWVSPYGSCNATALTALENDSNILGGSCGGDWQGSIIIPSATGENIYSMTYNQDPDDDETMGSVGVAANGTFLFTALYHPGTEWDASWPVYGGTGESAGQALKDLLVSAGLGGRTPAEIFTDLRNCADVTVTGQLFTWDSTNFVNYIDNGDLTASGSGSNLVDAGATVSLTEDIIGTERPQGSAYDIGAYELEQSSGGGAALRFFFGF